MSKMAENLHAQIFLNSRCIGKVKIYMFLNILLEFGLFVLFDPDAIRNCWTAGGGRPPAAASACFAPGGVDQMQQQWVFGRLRGVGSTPPACALPHWEANTPAHPNAVHMGSGE